jgi:protein transport protein SEC24
VITTALPTTSSIADLYAAADPVAIATLLANKAVERSMQARLEDARDAVTNKLVDILGSQSSVFFLISKSGWLQHTLTRRGYVCLLPIKAYKATMTAAGTGPSPQLVVSENLKILPLLLLGLLKHVSPVPIFYIYFACFWRITDSSGWCSLPWCLLKIGGIAAVVADTE